MIDITKYQQDNNQPDTLDNRRIALETYLRLHSYEGLVCPTISCTCPLDDLMHCDGVYIADCIPDKVNE